MKISVFARIAALAALSALAAFAADVNGKWVAQIPGRDGNPQETTFQFKADGGKLTGSMTSPRGTSDISNGKVDGDDVSFSVALSFNGNDIKINFKGKASGSEIKFVREVEGRDFRSEFTAKKGS